MRVEQLMTREVQTCGPGDTLDRAAQLMWDHDCGCLPVVSGNGVTRVEGLLTDRDICMCALFQGKPLHEMRVSEAMTQDVRSCKASDSLSTAEQVMSEGRVRRLPVTDEQEALIGMISLADLAREAVQESRSAQPEIIGTEVGNTLAAICQPTASGAA